MVPMCCRCLTLIYCWACRGPVSEPERGSLYIEEELRRRLITLELILHGCRVLIVSFLAVSIVTAMCMLPLPAILVSIAAVTPYPRTSISQYNIQLQQQFLKRHVCVICITPRLSNFSELSSISSSHDWQPRNLSPAVRLEHHDELLHWQEFCSRGERRIGIKTHLRCPRRMRHQS